MRLDAGFSDSSSRKNHLAKSLRQSAHLKPQNVHRHLQELLQVIHSSVTELLYISGDLFATKDEIVKQEKKVFEDSQRLFYFYRSLLWEGADLKSFHDQWAQTAFEKSMFALRDSPHYSGDLRRFQEEFSKVPEDKRKACIPPL